MIVIGVDDKIINPKNFMPRHNVTSIIFSPRSKAAVSPLVLMVRQKTWM
jgi:hypothetical protein